MTALLLVVGLQAVYSASFVLGIRIFDDANYFLSRQVMWAGVGIILLLVCMRIDYHRWKALSPLIMLAVLIAMALVIVPGVGETTYGATRWLRLPGPLPPIQPSEFAKLALIIYMSAWLATRGDKLRQTWAGFIPFVLVIGVTGGLVMMQPDMGTTITIVLIATTLFFIAGADLKHMVLLLIGGGAAGFLLMFGAGYRAGRWSAFVDPWQDPQGQGFHIIQSLIALGSGGIGGLGPGASRQKFFYIPGSHTDGVFAIIGEEVGFIGSVIVILLFVALAYRGFHIAANSGDNFGSLLAVGITCWIVYQALINIGSITKSIPMTGIPLPFISFGGSSLATLLAGIGILLNISRQTVPKSPGGQ